MNHRLTRLVLAPLVLCLSQAAPAAPFSNLYFFGDSLTDNGNFFGFTDAAGSVTGGVPVPLAPPYSAGRFQNGPSYAEHLYTGLGLGTLMARGYTGLAAAGTNYAVGGARSSYHNLDLVGGLPPANPGTATFRGLSLNGQLDLFRADKGSAFDAQALYTVFAGSNDVQDALALFGAGNSMGGGLRLQSAIGDTFTVINGLVAGGARHFLIPTLPDLGKVPAILASGAMASATATQLAQSFNSNLSTLLAGLQSSTPGLNVLRFDTFAFLQGLTASGGGFTNVTTPCLTGLFVAPRPSDGPVAVCSEPDKHLFWDAVHPSAAAHSLLSTAMLQAIPVPAAAWLLISALPVLATRTRRQAA